MTTQTSRLALIVGVLSLALIVGFAPAAFATPFSEVGDASDTVATAQFAGSLPTLTQITGNIQSETDADLFLIALAVSGRFSATTVNGPATLIDTQLFLFDSSGHGILANDDITGSLRRSALPPTLLPAGNYLLAVSGWDRDPLSGSDLIFPTDNPFTGVFGPNSNVGPLTGWGGSGETGTYLIDVALELQPLPDSLQPVPEPATLILFGSALAGIGMARRRFHKRG